MTEKILSLLHDVRARTPPLSLTLIGLTRPPTSLFFNFSRTLAGGGGGAVQCTERRGRVIKNRKRDFGPVGPKHSSSSLSLVELSVREFVRFKHTRSLLSFLFSLWTSPNRIIIETAIVCHRRYNFEISTSTCFLSNEELCVANLFKLAVKEH